MHTVAFRLAVVAITTVALSLLAPWWGSRHRRTIRLPALAIGAVLLTAATLFLPAWTFWDDGIIWVAVIVAVIDAYEHLVPNRWVLCMFALAMWRLLTHGTWWPSVAVAGSIFAFLALFHLATAGIGWGDVKYAAAAALALGYPAAVWAITVGLGSAGLAAAGLLLSRRRQRQDTIALAPFLSLGIASALATLRWLPIR